MAKRRYFCSSGSLPAHVEIVVKAHALRGEDQEGRAESQGSGRDHGHAHGPGRVEQRAADFELEEIQPVQDHIHPSQKGFHVVRGQPGREWGDIQERVDACASSIMTSIWGGRRKVPWPRTAGSR
jgi:hypothetical protein